MSDLPFIPIVILGAGRSGTNVLRDVLCDLPKVATWPCDEIQPIWRHGNLHYPTDAIPADCATPDVVHFIRAAFMKIWKAQGRPDFIVEKTCANTLRVPFLTKVLPEAHFISIVRHGADVVPSAVKRWRGELEVPPLSYFAAKARYIPLRDLPVYGQRFVQNRLAKLRGKSSRLSTWGPIWDGLQNVQSAPLEHICAHQWNACVQATRLDLAQVDPARVHQLTYEALVSDPQAVVQKLAKSLGVPLPQDGGAKATSIVRRKALGMGPRSGLSDASLNIIAGELSAHGYGVS